MKSKNKDPVQGLLDKMPQTENPPRATRWRPAMMLPGFRWLKLFVVGGVFAGMALATHLDEIPL